MHYSTFTAIFIVAFFTMIFGEVSARRISRRLRSDSDSTETDSYSRSSEFTRRTNREVTLKDFERLKRQATDNFADLEGRVSENALNIIKLLHKNGHYDDSTLKFEPHPKAAIRSGLPTAVNRNSSPEYVQVSGKLEIL